MIESPLVMELLSPNDSSFTGPHLLVSNIWNWSGVQAGNLLARERWSVCPLHRYLQEGYYKAALKTLHNQQKKIQRMNGPTTLDGLDEI